MARLVKIDRNGSKHYEGYVECTRCFGSGIYTWGGTVNGVARHSGVCFRCNGAGKTFETWIERTPEYQAKLDAKRQERHERMREERRAEQERREAEMARERAEREAAEAARRAISQHIGEEGQRIQITVTLERVASFEVASFRGFGTDTMHVYTFADNNGNKLVWKTTSGFAKAEGEQVTIKATVKTHSEYRGEKQTELQRVKIA